MMPSEQSRTPPEMHDALERATAHARSWLRACDRPGETCTKPDAQPPSLLFAGADRAVATRTARQLARELGRDLYRVELPAMVSKFRGETEKNLNRTLENAERTGAVLLIDESDALFGKRTDVRDSHDRYANLEIEYLQRRLASFAGIAVFACRAPSGQLGAAAARFKCVVDLAP